MEVREPNARYLVKPGFKQTEVGVIPEDWDCVQLTHVAKLESGHTPSRRHPEYWGGDIPWVSLHDTDSLGGREIYTTSQTVTNEGIKHSSARLLPKGTVVFSRTATVGKVTTLGRDMATSQDFANYICGPRVFNYFLVYLFRWMAPEWEKLMAGSTHNSIYMPAFQSLKIVLPPRPEQQAIAEALSDADALIESLEHLLAKKCQIKQGAMQELLTGQKRLPGFGDNWAVTRLGDIAEIVMGQSPRSANYNAKGDGLPLIQGNADISNRKTIKRVFTTEVTKQGRRDDILMSVRAPVGEISIAIFDVCLGRGVCAIRYPNDFLFHALIAKEPLWAMLSKGSTFDSVNSIDVKAFQIEMPENEQEQTAIASVLSDLDAELAALETRLTKARQLKQGMMQELLTGRIRLVQPKAEVIPFPVKEEAKPEKGKSHNWQINEAVVISVLAKHFGSAQWPLGRKRYTKLSYLLHRHVERQAEGYLKKRAGPYNPATKYGGPEGIALKKGYVQQHTREQFSGFVAGEHIGEAETYFLKWYGEDVLDWLEQFRRKTNDDLELLATVDMAMEDLRRAGCLVRLDSVKEVIRSNPEWQAKLDRPIFSDDNIEHAIIRCNTLFGEH
ncbi:restriction endonuclease subunit S [Quatrionicoccus australiensis]|uniref:restriction endonuclease subunit S n=1 Tax=Quatrionicoccus australiensis TaxID=138118 RepID=UPI001CF9C033|nr:restriction endonuclease subunit S [Quatrionicoccus australiensis]MCB4361848.1 restriction endonuclease subunit S [Quatrionicoccus australiensis]